MFKKVSGFTAALFLALSLTATASTLTLTPADGTLYGTPGSTVGWGFTVESDDYYLLLFDVSFDSTAGWGDFVGFTGDLGSLVVEPGLQLTRVFDAETQTGVGSFALRSYASPGFVTSGVIDISYGRFSVNPNDPLFDPDRDTISLDNVFSNTASVVVTADASPGPTPVPEPSTLLLLGAGIGGLYFVRRRKPGREGAGQDKRRNSVNAKTPRR